MDKFDASATVLDRPDLIADWGEDAIHVRDAWKLSRGKGIRVAILDTGWPDHADVSPNVIAQSGFTGDSGADTEGHGTHVAGIVGAIGLQGGVIGVAPECSLLCAKVIPGSAASIIDGLNWAHAWGADIVNMSFGGYNQDRDDVPEIHTAIQSLYMQGVILVAAAGNEFTDNVDTVAWPARYPEVIAVAALDQTLRKAAFSPWGPELQNAVAMPGLDIPSTWLNQQYALLSGTSMAAPMLSGLIACMFGHFRPSPSMTHALVSSELAKISNANADWHYVGIGMPDASRI